MIYATGQKKFPCWNNLTQAKLNGVAHSTIAALMHEQEDIYYFFFVLLVGCILFSF